MRALVIGASGQVGGALGRELARRGHTVVGTHAHGAGAGTVLLDLGDASAIERLLGETAPDWVFCAGASGSMGAVAMPDLPVLTSGSEP